MANAAVLSRIGLLLKQKLNPGPTDALPTEDEIRAALIAQSFGQHVGTLLRTPPDFPIDIH
jgi:hypothetical protein